MIEQGLKTTGEFTLKTICSKTGKCLEEFHEKNLVVTLGHTNISKLLGGDVAGKAITKIAVGTSGAAPALANSALTGMFSKALGAVTYPEANSIRFDFEILTSEANGMTIREFGLLNVNNVLFARKVRADIVKTNAVSLVGSWKIVINS